jgi:hypothetical protein
MGEHVIGRRQMLRGAGVAAGGVAVTGLGLASPAVASDDSRGALAGSWLVTRQDNGSTSKTVAVLSFAGGGVVIAHDINPAGPPFTGTWARRGDGRFRATLWSGFTGMGPNQPGVTVKVHVEGRVRGDTISATYSVKVFDDATGAAITAQAATGRLSGHLIEA